MLTHLDIRTHVYWYISGTLQMTSQMIHVDVTIHFQIHQWALHITFELAQYFTDIMWHTLDGDD